MFLLRALFVYFKIASFFSERHTTNAENVTTAPDLRKVPDQEIEKNVVKRVNLDSVDPNNLPHSNTYENTRNAAWRASYNRGVAAPYNPMHLIQPTQKLYVIYLSNAIFFA